MDVIVILLGNSLMAQWLELYTFIARDPGAIPGQGTKILKAMQCGQKRSRVLHLWVPIFLRQDFCGGSAVKNPPVMDSGSLDLVSGPG